MPDRGRGAWSGGISAGGSYIELLLVVAWVLCPTHMLTS